jgi:tRNA modification GTPase
VSASGAPSLSDTILGIATPAGTAAIGVIRISGPHAIPIVSKIVRPSSGSLEACEPRRLYRAPVVDQQTGEQLDVALVVVMPGPASYTGDDVVELSCHGNPVLLEAIVNLLVVGGARLAAPGEFTRRAYLRGRLDLLQVEGVAELIGARTERAIRLAARQLTGGLSDEVGRCRERLLDLIASLEVALDFPDDEVGIGREVSGHQAVDIVRELDILISAARRGRGVQDGLSVMLAGAPNVGKSSLLNRLLGAERAIVSPTPGTTRDLVDGTLVIEGVAVRIIDGAGLADPLDAIDAEGMRRARQALETSDLVLVVLDRSRPVSSVDRDLLDGTSGCRRLVIANKCDVPSAWEEATSTDCACSALTGAGVDDLVHRLGLWVRERTTSDGDEGGFVASLRVLDGLSAVRSAIDRGAHALIRGVPYEAALVDLREAHLEIDRVLGREAEDAVLDRIFAAFCIGK